MSRNVELEGSRDLILRERSYSFSTPGNIFVGFCFLWNKKTDPLFSELRFFWNATDVKWLETTIPANLQGSLSTRLTDY